MQRLIGTPERFFYTGMPPTVVGGPYPLLVFIDPFVSLNGRSGIPAENCISYPPRVLVKRKIQEKLKNL